VKVTDVHLSKEALANLRGRFFLLVDQSGDGCWPWLGPRHSSGAGRYLWSSRDGGNDRYILCHRLAYYLATGELPSYLRNLCGNPLCCKASHWWAKPNGRWKPKAKKAIRGRVRQLSTEEVRHIRLLATLSHHEEAIGQQFGLTKRQVAQIAMGKLRPEAGGRLRSSRFKGIRFYHHQHEQELLSLSMRPDEPVVTHPPDPKPELPRTPSNGSTGFPIAPGRPFPYRAYGQIQGRHLPRRPTFPTRR
jgi:hypothetical protein